MRTREGIKNTSYQAHSIHLSLRSALSVFGCSAGLDMQTRIGCCSALADYGAIFISEGDNEKKIDIVSRGGEEAAERRRQILALDATFNNYKSKYEILNNNKRPIQELRAIGVHW